MNAPDPYDRVRLPEGVPKVRAAGDEKLINAIVFEILREDHTLGNLLRMQLLQDPAVTFAGYQIPHPLVNDVIIKVQTEKGTSPGDAFLRACGDLRVVFDGIDRAVTETAVAWTDAHGQDAGDV